MVLLAGIRVWGWRVKGAIPIDVIQKSKKEWEVANGSNKLYWLTVSLGKWLSVLYYFVVICLDLLTFHIVFYLIYTLYLKMDLLAFPDLLQLDRLQRATPTKGG